MSLEVDPGRGKKGPCSPMKAVPTEEQPGPLRGGRGGARRGGVGVDSGHQSTDKALAGRGAVQVERGRGRLRLLLPHKAPERSNPSAAPLPW